MAYDKRVQTKAQSFNLTSEWKNIHVFFFFYPVAKAVWINSEGLQQVWKYFSMDHSGVAGSRGGGHAGKTESRCQTDSTSNIEE